MVEINFTFFCYTESRNNKVIKPAVNIPLMVLTLFNEKHYNNNPRVSNEYIGPLIF